MASLDLDWLDDLLLFEGEGMTFTQAAQKREVSPSTLSRRISSLEDWVGVGALLDRESIRIKLNEAGRAFATESKKAIVDMRNARHKAAEIVKPVGARFVTLHSLAATFAPLVISRIRDLMDDNELKITTSIDEGHISECMDAIYYGRAPFMICYEHLLHKIIFPAESKNTIESVVIAKDRLVPVCARANLKRYQAMLDDCKEEIRRYGDKPSTPSDDKRLPYSTYSLGTYLSELVRDKIKDHPPDPDLKKWLREEPLDIAITSDTLRNLVREKQGIAWVLLSTAQRALEARDELVRFDFGLNGQANIDLEIKMFHATHYQDAAHYKDNDIEKAKHIDTINRIWEVAKNLQKVLTFRDSI